MPGHAARGGQPSPLSAQRGEREVDAGTAAMVVTIGPILIARPSPRSVGRHSWSSSSAGTVVLR